MKILLTGSSGMVGQNILECEKPKGWSFLTPTRNDLDLKKYNLLNDYISENKPDLVIHCAAIVGGIQANIDNPLKFLNDNLLINYNVINASFKNGVKKLINIASSCMYPSVYSKPISEELLLSDYLEPTNEGYALSKILGLKTCEIIDNNESSFFYKTLVPCNLFGRHDNFDSTSSHLLPAIIKKIHNAIKKNQTQLKYGDQVMHEESLCLPLILLKELYFLQKKSTNYLISLMLV